jgi:hypothetical protein
MQAAYYSRRSRNLTGTRLGPLGTEEFFCTIACVAIGSALWNRVLSAMADFSTVERMANRLAPGTADHSPRFFAVRSASATECIVHLR